MAKAKTKWDRRLIGFWKSDRRRTFRDYRPQRMTPSGLRKLKSLFGKMEIRWGRGKYRTELNGYSSTDAYIVVASDAESVVVKMRNQISGEDRLQYIQFDGDLWYWITTDFGVCEFFKRSS